MINNQQYLIPQQMMQQHNGQVAVAYTNANGQPMNPNNLAYVQTLNHNNPQTVAQYTAAAQNNYTHQNNMLMNTNNLNSNVMMNKMDVKKGKGSSNKPKGRMSAYTFFVQTCREEHRKKHPNENVNFTEFSKKCAERWKQMTENEKKRFATMAEKDKARYDREMSTYVPAAGEGKKKRKKDPNAPKRPLSAFFMYCADERAPIKAAHPSHSVGDIAKELGEKWNKVTPDVKAKYEAKAAQDKIRYEKAMAEYKNKGVVAAAAVDDDDDDEDDEE